LRAPEDELDLVEDVIANFPVAELRCDNNTWKVGVFCQGQSKEGGGLRGFVGRVCVLFESGKFSTGKRVDLDFNVLVSRASDFQRKNIERAITMNVPKGGFNILSYGKWQIAENAWFIIKNLSDQAPICGIVC